MGPEARIWLLSLAIAAAFSAGRIYAQGLRGRWGRGWFVQMAVLTAIGLVGWFAPLPDPWPVGLAVVGWAGLLLPNFLSQRFQQQLHMAVWGFDLAGARLAAARLRWVAIGPVRGLSAAKVAALAAALAGRHAEAEAPLLAYEGPDAPAALRRSAQATRLFVRLHAHDLEGIVALARAMEPPPGTASAEVAGLAARACLELGRPDEALDWLGRLKGDEHMPVGIDLVAVPVYALLGAEDDLEETISRIGDKWLPPAMQDHWRGRARAVRGDRAGARALIERSMAALGPTQTEARKRAAFALTDLDAADKLDAADRAGVDDEAARRPWVVGARVALTRARRTAELVRGGRVGTLPKVLGAIVAIPSLVVLAGLEGWLPALGPWAERAWFACQLDRRVLTDGEAWRLLSHMGLHAHLTHLALNLLALYWLAGRTARLHGPGATVAAFVAGGLAGGVVHLWLSQEAAVGASGGVLALLGLLAVGWLRARGLLADRARRRLLIEMGAVIGLQLVFDQFVPQVAAAAHAGGLAAGLLLGAVWPLGARKAAEREEAAAAGSYRTAGGSRV